MTSSITQSPNPDIRPATGTASIVVPASPESAGIARSFLREHSTLDSMRHMEADLLVTELICNVIQHCAGATELEIEIQGQHAQGVRTSVTHNSSAPLEYERPGVGFRLLERLARRWGHEFVDGKLSVWFVLRKPGLAGSEDESSDDDMARNLELDPAGFSNALVRRHRDLAIAIARRYRGKGIPLEDLNQVAMMALHKAILRYDPAMGELRPYAAATISGELKHFLRDSGWSVRVPRSVQESALETSKVFEALTQQLGRVPSVRELADHVGMTEEEALEAVWARLLYASRSIDKESNTTGLTILEHLQCPETEIGPEDRLLIDEAIAGLPDREALIVRLSFMEEKTQQEIAEIIGVSQMHVSRLLAGALRQMRGFLESSHAVDVA